jgi:hypothetical protein
LVDVSGSERNAVDRSTPNGGVAVLRCGEGLPGFFGGGGGDRGGRNRF